MDLIELSFVLARSIASGLSLKYKYKETWPVSPKCYRYYPNIQWLLVMWFCMGVGIRVVVGGNANRIFDMGHCIATLCRGSAFDPDEFDTVGLLPESGTPAVGSGIDATLRVDNVITQGLDGAHAMDRLMRDCLQCEPGARLHVCVAYTLLRMEVMRGAIIKKERVFMPDHMILYVEPSGIPVDRFQVGKCQVFMRVRVFRFLVIPMGISRDCAKRKAGCESTDSDDESGVNGKCLAITPQTHKTLRHRMR